MILVINVLKRFDGSCYNRSLIVFPNGNRHDGGSGFISLYVAIDNSTLVFSHQEVIADLRVYVFSRSARQYFTMQGTFFANRFYQKNLQCVYSGDIYLSKNCINRSCTCMAIQCFQNDVGIPSGHVSCCFQRPEKRIPLQWRSLRVWC